MGDLKYQSFLNFAKRALFFYGFVSIHGFFWVPYIKAEPLVLIVKLSLYFGANSRSYLIPGK